MNLSLFCVAIDSETGSSLEPLHAQLVEVEADIDESLEQIATIKAKILDQEERSTRMIGSLGIMLG